MGEPIKVKILGTNSSYVGYKKDKVNNLENWTTARLSIDVPVLCGGTASLDAGAKTVVDFGEDELKCNVHPAFEAKYKQKFTNNDKLNARAYVRWRNSEGSNQLRLAAGSSYSVNKNLSIYADAHYTVSGIGDGEPGVSKKAGGWVGVDYNVKSVKGLNIWVEPIQINTDGEKLSYATNAGISYRFGK